MALDQNPNPQPQNIPQSAPQPSTPQAPNLNPQPTAMPMPQQSFFKQNKWSIFTIVVSLIAIVVVAYFVLRKPGQTGPVQPKVAVSIDAPNQIASGSELVYKIKVANSDSAAIKNVSLDVIYPQGFQFTDSTPKPTKLNGTQFALPIIEPSQDATIMIKGNIQGNADEVKTI